MILMILKNKQRHALLWVLIASFSPVVFASPLNFVKEEIMSPEEVAHFIPTLSQSIHNFSDVIATSEQKASLNKYLETEYKRYVDHEMSWERFRPLLNWYTGLQHLAYKGDVANLQQQVALFDEYMLAEQQKTILLKEQSLSQEQQDEMKKVEKKSLELSTELGWMTEEKTSWWSRLKPWQKNLVKASALTLFVGGGIGLYLHNQKPADRKKPDEGTGHGTDDTSGAGTSQESGQSSDTLRDSTDQTRVDTNRDLDTTKGVTTATPPLVDTTTPSDEPKINQSQTDKSTLQSKDESDKVPSQALQGGSSEAGLSQNSSGSSTLPGLQVPGTLTEEQQSAAQGKVNGETDAQPKQPNENGPASESSGSWFTNAIKSGVNSLYNSISTVYKSYKAPKQKASDRESGTEKEGVHLLVQATGPAPKQNVDGTDSHDGSGEVVEDKDKAKEEHEHVEQQASPEVAQPENHQDKTVIQSEVQQVVQQHSTDALPEVHDGDESEGDEHQSETENDLVQEQSEIAESSFTVDNINEVLQKTWKELDIHTQEDLYGKKITKYTEEIKKRIEDKDTEESIKQYIETAKKEMELVREIRAEEIFKVFTEMCNKFGFTNPEEIYNGKSKWSDKISFKNFKDDFQSANIGYAELSVVRAFFDAKKNYLIEALARYIWDNALSNNSYKMLWQRYKKTNGYTHDKGYKWSVYRKSWIEWLTRHWLQEETGHYDLEDDFIKTNKHNFRSGCSEEKDWLQYLNKNVNRALDKHNK